MKVKKVLVTVFGALIVGLTGLFVGNQQVQAAAFRPVDTFQHYVGTATINGTWGANLFSGNDQNKVFQKVLPKDSQWQIFGYTHRSDGYYYYAGGDLWIQGNQAKVPVNSGTEAILNTVATYGDVSNPANYWRIASNGWINGYWGNHYMEVTNNNGGGVVATYIVYGNGDAVALANNPTVQPEQPNQTGSIVGNKASRIYHTPDQRNYYIHPKNIIYFASEQEAINAGYRKAFH
ncbi:hypothetical protein FC83_GL002276 [Agrilactobacillus composti DSM 18527 = JCM 14202]|uniref:Surface layer protein A domain-containing protein n=1 Tax=Agrilactobacillus composti DSM 18527 = JCM 14202 TaxID=1423734 RepID=X0PTN5_9LACO|nr:hypothetical protein [Agrilactobacillus composti]KRM36871.1 hypothetical protein FC83_GL002276 [Agrilactobacillus composti DSM 18527 = JCM 14202]GAF41397.1 hypothetical protein JCM14202_3332 [Agrilactobacillus composti DSM 18527 = JCM 14202]